MSALDKMYIEITIRKKRIDKIPEKILKIFGSYIQYESDSRLVIDVPVHNNILTTELMLDILKTFNEAVYISLAYITNGPEIVTSLHGDESVDRIDIVYQGMKCVKYIKKGLRILTILDESSSAFAVEGYILDLGYSEPIIKVLDVYSVGNISGIGIDTFLNR